MCKVMNPVHHDLEYLVLRADDHWDSDKVQVIHDCREMSVVMAHPTLGPTKVLLAIDNRLSDTPKLNAAIRQAMSSDMDDALAGE